MPNDVLSRLAVRVSEPGYDPRHAILDVSGELLPLAGEADRLPPRLAGELGELLAQVRLVQPNYPSRRETSPLFDREGLGRLGYERAERIVKRLVALARAAGGTRIADRE
jgi:hypothetical protein